MNRSVTETVESLSLDQGRFLSTTGNHAKAFVAGLRDNIVASGRNPVSTAFCFALAWGLFFFTLYALPTPQGLSPAGKACMAVVIWACVIWVSEAIPVGITGI